jgi:hypothetical protein
LHQQRRPIAKTSLLNFAAMDDTDMTDVAYDIDIDVGEDIAPAAQASQPQQVVQVSNAQGCTTKSAVD